MVVVCAAACAWARISDVKCQPAPRRLLDELKLGGPESGVGRGVALQMSLDKEGNEVCILNAHSSCMGGYY